MIARKEYVYGLQELSVIDNYTKMIHSKQEQGCFSKTLVQAKPTHTKKDISALIQPK